MPQHTPELNTGASLPQSRTWSVGRPYRRRTRLACTPCKLRKRKCNGCAPCDSCTRYEYVCSYDRPSQKSSKNVAAIPVDSLPDSIAPSTDAARRLSPPPSSSRLLHDINGRKDTIEQSIEANSGVVSARVLGLKLGTQLVPHVRALGWNLDLRPKPHPSERNIAWILSQNDWQKLFDVYVLHIHPIYGFLDLDAVLRQVSRRWRDPSAKNAYDHVLCSVAALGSLFSARNAHVQESHLIDCAREITELACSSTRPTFEDCEAWLLRTIYLRCSSSPHAAWMASCTAMHTIEAAGVHQEPNNISLVFADTASPSVNLECQRRLYWLAKLLNTWISFEYGRSPAVLQNASCKVPVANPGDPTTDLISLFRVSQSLDPRHELQLCELEHSLTQVDDFRFTFDALLLSQSNLAFTIYRRMRATCSFLGDGVTEKVIRLGRQGLHAASRLVDAQCPWGHVANVPFQFSCIILAMDTEVSLAHAQESVAILRRAAERFRTSITREAFETVKLLVQLSENRKRRDLALLSSCRNASQISLPACMGQTSTENDLDTLGDDAIPYSIVFSDSTMQTIDFSALSWDTLCTELGGRPVVQEHIGERI